MSYGLNYMVSIFTSEEHTDVILKLNPYEK
jgi:hypothetical protein